MYDLQPSNIVPILVCNNTLIRFGTWDAMLEEGKRPSRLVNKGNCYLKKVFKSLEGIN
jgi:hypothetical protein